MADSIRAAEPDPHVASNGGFFPWYGEGMEDAAAPALIDAGQTLSYAALRERIVAASRRLRREGVGPGARQVLAIDAIDADWVVALLAHLHAGAQPILPDPDWSPEVRRTCLAVLQSGSTSAVSEAGVWLFTSGTTSMPQPHFRSLAAMISMVERVRQRLPADLIQSRPASLAVAPLYHGYGLINALLLPHAIGGGVVLHEGEGALEMADSLRRNKVQVLFGWPKHFRLLSEGIASEVLRSAPLRWCVSSSSRLDPIIAARFTELSGCFVRQQYGTTETGPLCLDDEPVPMRYSDCVGRPLSGIEFRVLDAGGAPMPQGEEGMLAVRFAPGLNPNPLHIGDGAFWPIGDIGGIDDEGRVYVKRRLHSFTDERKEA